MSDRRSRREPRSFIHEFREGFSTEASLTNDWDSGSDDLLGPEYGIEEVIAVVFLLGTVISVIVGVIWRFAFTPLIWTLSGAMTGFLWSMLVGASIPNATDDHIQFDPVYNMLSPRIQMWCRVTSNALIVGTFAIAVIPSIDFVRSVGYVPVVGLPVSLGPVYGVIIWFLVATIVHRSEWLFKDIRSALHRASRNGQ